MTLFGLFQVLFTVGGIVAGIALGVKHSWWAAILGVPAGAVVGYAAYVILAAVMMFVALGPKEFLAKALPQKWWRQKS